MPTGREIVAVLASDPVALADRVAVRVYVAVLPTPRSTLSLMEPVPLGVHEAPEVATHVQVAPVKPEGKASATVAFDTAEGPAFDAMIV